MSGVFASATQLFLEHHTDMPDTQTADEAQSSK
jgi:hypothetical protein